MVCGSYGGKRGENWGEKTLRKTPGIYWKWPRWESETIREATAWLDGISTLSTLFGNYGEKQSVDRRKAGEKTVNAVLNIYDTGPGQVWVVAISPAENVVQWHAKKWKILKNKTPCHTL